MNSKLNKFKELNRMQKIKLASIAIISLIIIITILSTAIIQISKAIRNAKKEEIQEISYKIYSVNGYNAQTVITFASENKITTVTYKDDENKELILHPNNKSKISIDYKMKDRNSYNFKVEYSDSTSKEFTIDFEIPRIEGKYTLKNGIYVNEPDISTGFVPEKTRYMYLNNEENLVQGNWIVGDAPENWYDYKEQKWANIYVESEGLDSYYVWIPRYCYKVDTENSVTGNERMNIKFINVYNEYIDGITRRKNNMGRIRKTRI